MNHEGAKTQREPIPDEVENVARGIVDSAFRVHSQVGPGLRESINEECVIHELKKMPMKARRQRPIPVVYDGIRFETGLRLDLLVENCVLVELKAMEKIMPAAPWSSADLSGTVRASTRFAHQFQRSLDQGRYQENCPLTSSCLGDFVV